MMKCMVSIVVLGGGVFMEGLSITSQSFKPNTRLGNEYVYTECGGSNKSPHLAWRDAPTQTKSFVIICDDPDAPTEMPFVHWIFFNIPASVHEVAVGVARKAEVNLANTITSLQGKNDFGNIGYDGPCPPKGHGIHHYSFRIYALDTMLHIKAGATKGQLDAAIQGHVIATAEIVGLYER